VAPSDQVFEFEGKPKVQQSFFYKMKQYNPISCFLQFHAVTKDSNLISYEPEKVEVLDKHNKRLGSKIKKFIMKWIKYIIALIILIQILISSINEVGTERSQNKTEIQTNL